MRRAAAVVVAFVAALSVAQVPMYSDYPWGLLQSGTDKGPVYNLDCRGGLQCFTNGYGNGVIQLYDTDAGFPLTLDGIPDGVTFARVGKAGIDAGSVLLDFTLDGVYARPKSAGLTNGFTSILSRGGNTYATSTFFNVNLDNLDAVPEGATFGKVGKTNLDGGAVLLDSTLEGVFGRVARAKLDGGSVVLDLTLDGTYAKARAAGLTDGYASTLSRGGSTYATSTFLNSGLDTLDTLGDGTSFARPLKASLDGGYVIQIKRGGTVEAAENLFKRNSDTLDSVLDSASYRRVGTAYVDSSNRVTSVFDGAGAVAGSALFNKLGDTLDAIDDGALYGKVNLGSLSAGNPKTDSLVDGTYSKVASTYVDGSKRVTNIWNGSASVSGGNLFNKVTENLGSIANGGGYSKVNSSSVTSGEITSLSRGGSVYATSTFLNSGLDTQDTLPDGTTFARTAKASLDGGYVIQIKRSGVTVAAEALFKKTNTTDPDTMDGVPDGTSYARVNAAALSSGNPKMDSVVDGATYGKVKIANLTSGVVSAVDYGSGSTTSTANLFRKGTDTFANVAGTLADGQLGSNVVNTSNIKDSNITTAKVAASAITAPKLDDGISLSAYDEATPAGISSRATATNCTKGSYDGATGYIRFTVAASVTNPQVSTTLYTGTSTNLLTTKVVMRYRLAGDFTNKPPSAMTAINNANTAQTATATFVSDGAWHAAVFDISGWTTAGTLRVDLTTATSATSYLDIAYLATGNPGSGTGALISNAGNVGIGTASPGVKLDIDSGTADAVARVTGGGNVARLALNNNGTGGRNWSISVYKNTIGPNGGLGIADETAGAQRLVIDSSGNVGIGTTSPSAQLHVKSADTANTLYVEGGSGVLSYASFGTSSYLQNNQTLYFGTSNATPIIFRTNAAEVMRIQSGGNVGINRTSPSDKLDVDGTVRSSGSFAPTTSAWTGAAFRAQGSYGGGVSFIDGTAGFGVWAESSGANLKFGSGTTSGGLTERLSISNGGNVDVASFGTPGAETHVCSSTAGVLVLCGGSDERIKENIAPLSSTLRMVLGMRPVRYEWKDKENMGAGPEVGFIAQEMMQVVPEVVGVSPKGTYLIHYEKLVAVLAGAVQELYADRTALAERVQLLEDKAAAAERRLADLEARLARLEAR